MHETIIYVFVRHGNELSGGRDTTNREKKQWYEKINTPKTEVERNKININLSMRFMRQYVNESKFVKISIHNAHTTQHNRTLIINGYVW